MPVRVGLLCILLGVGGCAATPDPVSSQATCSMERVAEVPVRFADGAILVPAHINRTAVEMQVDTGSTASMIDESAEVRLGLPADPHRTTTLRGIGGEIKTQNASVLSFELGGQEWQSLSLSTGHLATAFHEATPVAGLLGADRLSVFDVELDVPHGRMTLWEVSHCSGDFALPGVPHYTVALTRHAPNREIALVDVDGHPVEALIDWGARMSTITGATAIAAGVTPAMLAADRSATSWGVDRNQNVLHVHRFAAFKVGRETFRGVGLGVADLHLQEAGMLLGADFARSRRIWLSYATQQMFVVPPNVARQPAS